jgi:hypothetical protein
MKLVGNRIARDGVLDALVDNLDVSVTRNVGHERAGLFNVSGLVEEGSALGVELVPRSSFGITVGNSVLLVTINGRVHSDGEDVLMGSGQDRGRDNGTPLGTLATIDVLGRDNTSSSNLELDTSGLIKMPGKNVLVVTNRQNSLENQDAATSDSRNIGTVVSVLPSDTIILLVHTNNVLLGKSITLRISKVTREVFDGTETVASKRELVSALTTTAVTKIKGHLTVKRRTRITIGNSHLRDRQSVKGRAAIKGKIMENHTLTRSETDSESPLLPSDQVALECERSTFRLDNIVRFEIVTGLTNKLRIVLVAFAGFKDVLALGQGVVIETVGVIAIVTSSAPVNAHNLFLKNIVNRNKRNREGVHVGVRMVVLGITGVNEKLRVTGDIALFIAAVHPTIGSQTLFERLKAALFKSSKDIRVIESSLLSFSRLPGVHRRMRALWKLLVLSDLLLVEVNPQFRGSLVFQNVVDAVANSGGRNRILASSFGLEVRNHQSLGRLLSLDSLDVNSLARVLGFDESDGVLNLLERELVKWVGSHDDYAVICLNEK